VDVAKKYAPTIGAGVGIGGGGAIVVVIIIIVLVIVLRARSSSQVQPDGASKKYTASAVASMVASSQEIAAKPQRIVPTYSVRKKLVPEPEPEPESEPESEPEPEPEPKPEPKPEIVSEASIEASPGVELKLGARVKANGYQEGTIRYIGDLKGVALNGIKYVGIELDEPEGSGDGSISGHKYFSCADFHALFTTVQFVEPL